MENEVWKPVHGYEGLYEVSSLGRVRSLDHEVEQTGVFCGNKRKYTRMMKGRILCPTTDNVGYLNIKLSKRETKIIRIHQLVASAFIGRRPEGYVIDHIDRNRSNNKVSNLRYVSNSVNVKNCRPRYRPDIFDTGHGVRRYRLRFSENGVRRCIGFFRTVEEAEEVYHRLYNERQTRRDKNI